MECKSIKISYLKRIQVANLRPVLNKKVPPQYFYEKTKTNYLLVSCLILLVGCIQAQKKRLYDNHKDVLLRR